MRICECGSLWGPDWDHKDDCQRWPGSEWARDHGAPEGVGEGPLPKRRHVIRRRFMFWIDRGPWWLWPVRDVLIWITCRLVGHDPIEVPVGRASTTWGCAWCLRNCPPAPTTERKP